MTDRRAAFARGGKPGGGPAILQRVTGAHGWMRLSRGDFPAILMSSTAKPVDLDPEITAFLRKPVDLQELLALVA